MHGNSFKNNSTTGVGGSAGLSHPALPDAGLTFPADHPAVIDRDNHRQPASGLMVRSDTKEIVISSGGWIDGPVTVGRGWTISRTSPREDA